MSGGVEIFHRPNVLKKRASTPGGLTPGEMLQRIQSTVSGFGDRYLDQARNDLNVLSGLVRAARGGRLDTETVGRVHALAHQLKGEGGSFGYPLVTAIGASLEAYLDKLGPERRTAADPGVVATHVEALRLVIRNNITGTGGAIEKQMLEGLSRVVAKALATVASAAG